MSGSTNGAPDAATLHEFESVARELDAQQAVETLDPASVKLHAPDLGRLLAEIKGQAHFLLYLADQIEESLGQLTQATDPCNGAFLCKVLAMYSNQLETKHQGLGERIAETCQEVYVTLREHDPD